MAVKSAEWSAAERCLEVIQQAAEKGTWQAAAWLLERRYPDGYGRQQHVKVKEEPNTQTGVLVVESMSEIDEWERDLEKYREESLAKGLYTA